MGGGPAAMRKSLILSELRELKKITFYAISCCNAAHMLYNACMTKIKTTYRTTIDFLNDCDTVIFEYEGVEHEGEVTLHDPEIHEDDCPEGHVYILFPAIAGREEFPFGMPVHEDDIVARVDEDGERVEL